MSLHITNLIFNTVLIFCQLNTMAAALPSRFSRRTTFLIFNAVGFALLGGCGLLTVFFTPDVAISIFGAAYWFPQIATGLFIAKQRGGQFWCIFFSCDVASVIASTGAYVIGSWFFPFDTANFGMLLVRIAGVLLGTAFAVLFLIPMFKRLLNTEGMPWTALAISVFIQEMMILLMTTSPKLIFYRPDEHINLLFVCISSGIVLSMLVRSLNRVKAAADHAKELASQLALSERYYAELTTQLQENRIHMHDLRHHVNTLNGLCSQGDLEGIASYTRTLEESIPVSNYHPYCISGAVNALLNHYVSICEEQGIELNCQIRIPALNVVDPLHLCVLFGNTLQNALDALEKLPKGIPRSLTIRAVRTDDHIAIIIINPADGPIRFQHNGLPASNKLHPGHGFGLISVQKIVRRYDGWLSTEIQEGKFILKAVLKDAPQA